MSPRHSLLALLVVVIWGLNFVVIDAGLVDVPPLVFLALRLWFDMAQVRLVASEERSVLRALRWAFGTTLRSFGSLYWLFLRISLTSWIAMAVIFWIWMHFVPHQHIGLSFLLGQIALLFWLAARLWQRAGETVWYERRVETVLPN